MNKIFSITPLAVLIILISCSSDKGKIMDESKLSAEKTANTETGVQLSFVDGYFATINPLEVEGVLIKNQNEFNNKFLPAKTMTNKISEINFTETHVGAIVMPPTEYDTKIIINKSYVKEDTLYIYYAIERSKVKRTFSTIPQLLFTFSSSLGINSIYLDK